MAEVVAETRYNVAPAKCLMAERYSRGADLQSRTPFIDWGSMEQLLKLLWKW
jgi:hypothetical protein